MGRKFTSPKGEVVGFNAIGRPYKDEYVFTLAFKPEDVEELLAKVEEAEERKKVNFPIKTLDDGRVGWTFKRKASGKKGSWPLDVVDAAKKAMGENPAEGSIMRVVFELYPTEYQGKKYARFTPTKVQCVQFVPYGDDGDLEEEDDGFTSSLPPQEHQPVAPSAEKDDDDTPVEDPDDF